MSDMVNNQVENLAIGIPKEGRIFQTDLLCRFHYSVSSNSLSNAQGASSKRFFLGWNQSM